MAKRFQRGVNAFASTVDDESPQALQALAALVLPGEQIYLAQVPAIATPPGLRLVKGAPALQMLGGALDAGDDRDVVELGEPDAAEMLALAQLTRPSPFMALTHRMGRYIGVRQHGRLVAMAGERFRQPGFTEVSGVCTHPDARGQRLARRLSALVAARIAARGEQPYLHVWAENAAAIALYEALGFRARTAIHVAVFERAVQDR